MSELEDLRNRPLRWSIDATRNSLCRLYDRSDEIGSIERTPRLPPAFSAEVAGVRWTLRTKYALFKNLLKITFEDGVQEVAKSVLTGEEYRATVDGVTEYEFKPSEPNRAVWRDANGLVAVSVSDDMNPQNGREWIRKGTVRAYEVCPLTHAPILVLLSLAPVAFDVDFLSNVFSPPH